jgi:hypothetical protein
VEFLDVSMEGVPTKFISTLLDVTFVTLVDTAVRSKWYCGIAGFVGFTVVVVSTIIEI